MSTTDPKVLEWLATIPTWPAVVVESREEMEGMRRLVVDVGTHPLRATYTTPGQFVALGPLGGDRRFFAVASDPRGSGLVEFLIGAGQAVADALLELRPEVVQPRLQPRPEVVQPRPEVVQPRPEVVQPRPEIIVELSGALGDGYPLHHHETYCVVGSGTGFASLRPVVDELAAGGRPVRVWVGGRPGGFYPFADALDAWSRSGVPIRQTTGHVSELVRGDLDALRAQHESSLALDGWRWLVCGSEVMQQATLKALVDAGVPRERVHFNW